MKFTVFGRGFIGTALARHLRSRGYEVLAPAREELPAIGADVELGHVIYAVGLTGDFRTRPFDTIDAHVTLLAQLLRRCRFTSWLYLSSTRVYSGLGADAPAAESTAIPVTPTADSLYDLSKLLGESLCLTLPTPTVRVARLSNVYGAGQSVQTFLGSALQELRDSGRLVIREAADSSKDYIALGDVLPRLEGIALRGQHRMYNVASGRRTTHGDLAARLAGLCSGQVTFLAGANRRISPCIDVSRVDSEFPLRVSELLDDIAGLL